MGNAGDEGCRALGLEAAAVTRCVKVQHIGGMADILADYVSRLRAVGHCYDLNFKDNLQDLRAPFGPLPLTGQSTHTPVEVHEIFIKPNMENLVQNCNAQNTLQITKPEESGLSLDGTSPKDVPQLEQKLMSLPELIPERVIKLHRMTHSAVAWYITCTANQMKITSKMPWTSFIEIS